jgi:hypothetical protein
MGNMEIKHEKPDTTKKPRTFDMGKNEPTEYEVRRLALERKINCSTAYIWRQGQGAWKVSFEGAE